MTLKYLIGDATAPNVPGNKIIAHISNSQGGWGSGFVLAVSKRWKQPEHVYRNNAPNLTLGTVQIVPVEPEITVVNMIAQEGFRSTENQVAVKYIALESCLCLVADLAKATNASVHMPRIGCALGGGSWAVVTQVITDTLLDENVSTYVYDFPGSTFNP